MTKDDFVDLIIEVCRTDATEDEQKAAAEKLAGPSSAVPAILALATFAQTWLQDLEEECDSACDRDQMYTRFRAMLDECVDVSTNGTSGATEGTAAVV